MDVSQQEIMTAYLMGWAYAAGANAGQQESSYFAQDSQEDGWVTLQNSEGENYRVNLKDKAAEKESQGKVTISVKGRDVTMTRKEAEDNLAGFEHDLKEARNRYKKHLTEAQELGKLIDPSYATNRFWQSYIAENSSDYGSDTKFSEKEFYLKNKDRFSEVPANVISELSDNYDLDKSLSKQNKHKQELNKLSKNMDRLDREGSSLTRDIRDFNSMIKKYKQVLGK